MNYINSIAGAAATRVLGKKKDEDQKRNPNRDHQNQERTPADQAIGGFSKKQ